MPRSESLSTHASLGLRGRSALVSLRGPRLRKFLSGEQHPLTQKYAVAPRGACCTRRAVTGPAGKLLQPPTSLEVRVVRSPTLRASSLENAVQLADTHVSKLTVFHSSRRPHHAPSRLTFAEARLCGLPQIPLDLEHQVPAPCVECAGSDLSTEP